MERFSGSKEERLATEKAWSYSSRRAGLQDLLKTLTGHDCRFELDGQVRKNGDILVQLKIHNDSNSSRNIKVRMFANAKYYTGIAGEEIDDFSKDVCVAGKKCKYYIYKLMVSYIDTVIIQPGLVPIKSLGPSDAIWRWRSWSTLVQVMASCLTAPNHYVNQCWLIISEVLWHSSEDIIIRRFEDNKQ